MRLSVVIPTRDRPELLADCLETLAVQAQPPGGMEILVVDDGSEEPLVLDGGRREVPVRCLRQPAGGLNAARNRGVEEARGELIAFLDDDTLVRPGWATAIHEGFATQSCEALGGRITLELGGELPSWVTRKQLSLLSHYDLGPAPKEVGRRGLPFGANFAVTRETLARFDGFRVDLDRVGTALISNGETELLRRILAARERIVYWPAADVAHRVPAERLTKEWFRRRAVAQGVSDVRTEPTGERTESIVRALLLTRETIRAARDLPLLARQLARERSRFDLALWLAYSRGRREELKRLRLRG
jgi:glycosyltransferase involved in cell wall biosynthesis